MTENTLITLIIVALALLIWVPAILWSVRRALRKNSPSRKNKTTK